MRKLLVSLVFILLAHSAYAYRVITTVVGTAGSFSCSPLIPSGPNAGVGVGAACLPPGLIPSKTNPHDPINFGADASGANDSTGALNAAYLAGTDVVFGTPGTYKMNMGLDCTGNGAPWPFCTGSQTTSLSLVTSPAIGNGNAGIHPPANTKLFCAPGVTLLLSYNLAYGHDFGMIYISNNNVAVIGCNFKGANSNSPSPFSGSTETLDFIAIDGASGSLVEGNTFSNTLAQGAVTTLPENGISANSTLRYNTFTNNAFYCFVVNSNNNGVTLDHNYGVDCAFGAEWDGCANGGTIGTNILFKVNYAHSVNGTCTSAPGGCVGRPPGFVPVGSGATTCSYAGVTVGGSNANSNFCDGGGSVAGQYGSPIDGVVTGALSPNQSFNVAASGCSCAGAC